MEPAQHVEDEAFTARHEREVNGGVLVVEMRHTDGTDAVIRGAGDTWSAQLGGERPSWEGLILGLLRFAAAASLLSSKGAKAVDFVTRKPAVQPRLVAGALLGLACAHHAAAGKPDLGDIKPVTVLSQPSTANASGPEAGTKLLGVPMPDKPLEDQLLPPCDPREGLEEVKGACWLRLANRPCPERAFEWKGECYKPVKKVEQVRPPTTVKE